MTPDPDRPPRIFLLSPANCGGVRAKMVMSDRAQFELARQLRTPEGAALGDIFSFVSGLYFRGKLTYARRFARPPDPVDPVIAGGVLVITPNAGLRASDTRVSLESFCAFADARIDLSNPAYRAPLERASRALWEAVGADCEVVLLGSIASGKYVEVLQPIFGDRLLFPPAFVGRGDMSRGGLMLRAAAAGIELDYVPIRGAVRHGQRPPRLEPLRRIAALTTDALVRAAEAASKAADQATLAVKASRAPTAAKRKAAGRVKAKPVPRTTHAAAKSPRRRASRSTKRSR